MYTVAGSQNCRCCYFQTPSVVHCMNVTASAQSPKFLRNFYPQTIFCQLLRVTRKRSCTSAGNAQAQLHFRDDQQRAFGISNISNCVIRCVLSVIGCVMSDASRMSRRMRIPTRWWLWEKGWRPLCEITQPIYMIEHDNYQKVLHNITC